MTWVERSPRATITWDEAKVIEGIYRGTIPTKTASGAAFLHVLDVDGQQELFFAPQMLAQNLGEDDVGRRIRIEYTGKELPTKNGRTCKEFRVFDDRDENEPAAGAGPAAEEEGVPF